MLEAGKGNLAIGVGGKEECEAGKKSKGSRSNNRIKRGKKKLSHQPKASKKAQALLNPLLHDSAALDLP